MKSGYRKTDRGFYRQDESGLWHYHHRDGGMVDLAATDALEHRPATGAAWFWFNGVPAPIKRRGDSLESLTTRWSQWANAYRTDAHRTDGENSFVKKVQALLNSDLD